MLQLAERPTFPAEPTLAVREKISGWRATKVRQNFTRCALHPKRRRADAARGPVDHERSRGIADPGRRVIVARSALAGAISLCAVTLRVVPRGGRGGHGGHPRRARLRGGMGRMVA